MAPSQRSSSPSLSLVFSDSDGHPVVFAIPDGTTTVGSASDNDVILGHASVSPHQIVIIREGDELTLQDLFAGETLVNDEVRRNGPLNIGDVLRLGEVKVRVIRMRETQALSRGRKSTRRLRLSGARPRVHLDEASETRTPSDSLPPAREPARVEPARAEPARAEPARAEPARPEPARPEPARPEPARPEPAVEQQRVADEEVQRARERDARRARALARARQLSDEMLTQDDFEELLEQIANTFLDVFSADRAVAVLFEEDGRNPLMTVERLRDGTDEGAGVAQEIIDRCLQVRSVIRVADGITGVAGLAAPLIAQASRALGLLYFERQTAGQPLDADEVHLMAMLTNTASLIIKPMVT